MKGNFNNNFHFNPELVFSKKELKDFKSLGININTLLNENKEINPNDIFISKFENNEIKLTQKQQKLIEMLNNNSEILAFGGARSGKTYLIILKLFYDAIKYNYSRQLVVRKHFSDVKASVLNDTIRTITLEHDLKYRINISSPAKIEFDNGSQILFSGLESSNKKSSLDKLLGSEYLNIYINEASQVDFAPYKLLKTRLAQNVYSNTLRIKNKIIVDCNPPSKTHWIYKYFIENINPDTNDNLKDELKNKLKNIQMNPIDNIENLSQEYIGELQNLGGSFSKRFYYGEFSTGEENSMFKEEFIKRDYINILNDFENIAIGVDPAVTAGENSDETGIIICAMKIEKGEPKYYVLGDYSGKYSSKKWASLIFKAYSSFFASNRKVIVIETNQGGSLLKDNLNSAFGSEKYILQEVHSKGNKLLRASLISSLYERGLVVHNGVLKRLEEQMLGLGVDLHLKNDDRIDALVYALTYLNGIAKVYLPGVFY